MGSDGAHYGRDVFIKTILFGTLAVGSAYLGLDALIHPENIPAEPESQNQPQAPDVSNSNPTQATNPFEITHHPKDKDRIVPNQITEKNIVSLSGFTFRELKLNYKNRPRLQVFLQSIDPKAVSVNLHSVVPKEPNDPSFRSLEWFTSELTTATSIFPGPAYRQGKLMYAVKAKGVGIELPQSDIPEPQEARMLVSKTGEIKIANYDPSLLSDEDCSGFGCKSLFGTDQWNSPRPRTVAWLNSSGELNVLTFPSVTRSVVTGVLECLSANPYQAINLSGGRAAGLIVQGQVYHPTSEPTRHALYTHPI